MLEQLTGRRSDRGNRMRYRCCFLNEEDQVVRVEEITGYDDGDARRGATSLLMRTGQFSGYELWRDGRKVDEYRPVSRPSMAR
jgi:hypothetical protein